MLAVTPEQAHALAAAARAMQQRETLREQVKAADKRLVEAVTRARDAGCTLRQIGHAIDTTHTGVAKILGRGD